MNHKLIKQYFLIASLNLVIGISAVTNAAVDRDDRQVETMKITISDLDLSQDEGVTTLYRRLKDSASKVCGTRDVHVTGSRVESSRIRKQFKRCYAKALNGAVQSIGNERLSDMHNNNT